MPAFPQLFEMSFMIIQIIYKLNPTLLRFGACKMVFLLWNEGSGKQDLRVMKG